MTILNLSLILLQEVPKIKDYIPDNPTPAWLIGVSIVLPLLIIIIFGIGFFKVFNWMKEKKKSDEIKEQNHINVISDIHTSYANKSNEMTKVVTEVVEGLKHSLDNNTEAIKELRTTIVNDRMTQDIIDATKGQKK